MRLLPAYLRAKKNPGGVRVPWHGEYFRDVFYTGKLPELVYASPVPKADFGADLAGRLDLCANELVANIISYAFDDGQRHEIALEVTAAPEGASLTVRDNGRPFNLLEAPAHRQPESIEQARIGGLGIHLVRQLSSGCRYRGLSRTL